MSACDSMSNFTAGVVRYQLAEQVTICVRHQLAEICQESAVGSQIPIPLYLPMLNQRLLTRIEEKKAKLDSLHPLPPAVVNRLKEQFTVEWIYNSNAIKGSTLTLRETQLILETGMTIGGKHLREHFEVINHKDAIEYVESLANQGEPITAFHVRQIHKLVLSRIDDENAGQYSKTQVCIVGAQHVPPES